jgi:hypothetical protein
MNNIYPFSVFYLTKSVYDNAGQQKNPAFKFVLKAILINIRFREKIGTHITFTTREILDEVQKEEYAINFKGFMQLGENIAFPEESAEIRGEKNFRLTQFAINKDGDVLGLVKIVVEDYETKQALRKIIDQDSYPLAIVTCAEALEELEVIEKKLFDMFSN